jgi:hypothetical protein
MTQPSDLSQMLNDYWDRLNLKIDNETLSGDEGDSDYMNLTFDHFPKRIAPSQNQNFRAPHSPIKEIVSSLSDILNKHWDELLKKMDESDCSSDEDNETMTLEPKDFYQRSITQQHNAFASALSPFTLFSEKKIGVQIENKREQLDPRQVNQLGELKAIIKQKNWIALNDFLKNSCYPIERTQIIELLIANELSLENVIELADLLNDLSLFRDYVLYFYDNIQCGPADHLFSDLFKPASFEKMKKFLDKGYPVEFPTIQQALYSCNYPCICLILQYATDSLLEKNASSILKELMKLEDPRMYELVIKRFPKILAKVDLFSLLREAILNGHASFIEWILTSEEKLNLKSLETLVLIAPQSYHLTIIKGLCQRLQSVTQERLYPAILNLELNDEQKLFEQISAFAVLSPLSDVFELTIFYPQIGKVLPQVLELISLLVRFPNKKCATEVNAQFEDITFYIQHSLKYAQENLRFIQKVLPLIQQISQDQLLDAIILNRVAKNKNLAPEYSQKYKYFRVTSYTALIDTTNEKLSVKECCLDQTRKTGLNRYGWSIRHFAEIAFDSKTQTWKIPTDDHFIVYNESFNTIQYRYNFKDSQEREQDCETSFFTANLSRWVHNISSDTLQKLEPHLEELHKKIFNFSGASSDRDTLLKMIATVVWLKSTNPPALRGTPHNVMIELYLAYAHNHLGFPIPKINNFFLDNVMLMLTFPKALENWNSFFEPTLDQALGKVQIGRAGDGEFTVIENVQEQQSLSDASTVEKNGKAFRLLPDSAELIRTLLAQNGLLLRACSDQVRNHEEYALIAVRQNREALAYVSQNLQQQILELLDQETRH